jgi:DNA-binding winged helix-turn-helix (wHTH) protein/tetratricopeptide (TPR) repeat protein/TolB-like protein
MPPYEVRTFLDFKFDVTSRDLMRGGMKLRMPEQTSRMLAILLEHAGSVVTREEIQILLWPNGEFLDHERAINRIITHLRSVLRDDPRKPKYIETVHKRGYRFLLPVSITTVPMPTQPDIADPDLSVLASGSSDSSSEIPSVPVISIAQDSSSFKELVSTPGHGPALELRPHLAAETTASVVRTSPFAGRGRLVAVLSAALLLTASALTVLWFHHHAPVKHDNALALGLAPFQSEGPGAEQTGESFRLDLADALSQLPDVQVRATNSLGGAGHDDSSLKAVSEKLHLDILLLGRFRIQGDRCIMQFELIRSRDFLHLASFQYEGGRGELAIIRDKLQRDLFLRLQGETKSAQSIRGSTENPQAYSEYLQARELTQIRDPVVLEQALSHYKKAIDLDPRFAQAYAGMATVHLTLRYFVPADHQQKARQLANTALALDPELAEAHAVLGDLAFRSAWDFKLGERELRRAVELEPQKSTYHAWLAGLLADEQRDDEARQEIDLAITDDPLWPSVYSMAAFVDGAARDNTRMLSDVHKYVSLVPDSAYTHNQLAWAFFSAKRYNEALAEWQLMAKMDRDPARIALEDRGQQAFQKGGILSYAHVRLDAMEHHTINTIDHGNDFVPAEWYAFVGQPDKAMPSLQQIVASHSGEAVGLAVDPMFDNLHDDPRFRALLRQVGLPGPGLTHAL